MKNNKTVREYLFRGLPVGGKKYVYGGYVKVERKGKKYYIYTEEWATYGPEKFEVIPETVGQFIGLRDKNKVKIFEGDIVEIAVEECNTSSTPRKFFSGIVEYSVECKYIVRAGGGQTWHGFPNENAILEIIGNVHTTPELLTGANAPLNN